MPIVGLKPREAPSRRPVPRARENRWKEGGNAIGLSAWGQAV